MREIKFRAWNPDNPNHDQRMVINPLFRCDAKDVLNKESIYKNWTLMQYTCLKDKNGLEIYEGDIIEFDEEHQGAVVLELYTDAETYADIDHLGYIVKYMSGEYETRATLPDVARVGCVIGNIYEHPNLLGLTIDFLPKL